LIALTKYIEDYNLQISVEYHGIDNSSCWQYVRCETSSTTFYCQDISEQIDLFYYDIIFIAKVFSTLVKNRKSSKFLNTLKNAIVNQMKNDGFLIFNDINTNKMGRDKFHKSVKKYFKNIRQYYFPRSKSIRPRSKSFCHHEPDWIPIKKNNIVMPIPEGLTVDPLMSLSKTVIFEYSEVDRDNKRK
jgi:hypothetical protein